MQTQFSVLAEQTKSLTEAIHKGINEYGEPA